jgi:hypothetical protein
MGYLLKESFTAEGVRQRDPLSPMLFLLAMEPLHTLIAKAQEDGLLSSLSRSCDTFRMSLYADVVAIFIKPDLQDLKVTIHIMNTFDEASGLHTNLEKTECYPIQCNNLDLSFLASINISISQFPCSYLGLPLHFKKPTRPMLQPVIEKIRKRLPSWKKNFFSYHGRKLLINSILSAMPTYFLTIYKMPKWGLSKIDRYRRSFLWKGENLDIVKGVIAWLIGRHALGQRA